MFTENFEKIARPMIGLSKIKAKPIKSSLSSVSQDLADKAKGQANKLLRGSTSVRR